MIIQWFGQSYFERSEKQGNPYFERSEKKDCLNLNS